MLHIRDNAELAVRNLLKEVCRRQGSNELSAVDHLDEGTPIALKVTIDEKEGSAVFDFEGTGPEIYGNLNAPVSVTYSAIIYCLRAMVDQDVRRVVCFSAPDVADALPRRSRSTKAASSRFRSSSR